MKPPTRNVHSLFDQESMTNVDDGTRVSSTKVGSSRQEILGGFKKLSKWATVEIYKVCLWAVLTEVEKSYEKKYLSHIGDA